MIYEKWGIFFLLDIFIAFSIFFWISFWFVGVLLLFILPLNLVQFNEFKPEGMMSQPTTPTPTKKKLVKGNYHILQCFASRHSLLELTIISITKNHFRL